MNRNTYAWEIKLSLFLIAVSALIFLMKFLIIGDEGSSNTLTYILNALGFLPLNVLLVTLILNSMITRRTKKEQQEKMKMIVGLFFSELGNRLLHLFTAADMNASVLRENLNVEKTWKKAEYRQCFRFLSTYRGHLVLTAETFTEIRTVLSNRHEFLLHLVENPVFLEREKVTGLMQALFHLGEELSEREDFSDLPKTDTAHLSGDVTRVYLPLIELWVSHMEYLSVYYPYLFSLSIRKNPIPEKTKVIVTD